MRIRKNSYAIRISDEQLFMHRGLFDPRYERKVERVVVTEPTEADWTAYRTAKRCHEYLLESPYFEDGGPDERSTVNPPEPTREYIYAETVDEWIARCKAMEEV